ncbi:phage terminase large subunit [Roseomonas sp. SSH11]|uniref:Phage terminase large subunit n=1 Tax=Pararoseomonas baculiformis TaxID=2820812 RepID=A0ABS4AHZ4_9PROT|nr:phage terminase large subunit [Pararoseomonas baculiformis]MBP0446652.1 phage terminase large subunit [Pararoseomonas baculiformis]
MTTPPEATEHDFLEFLYAWNLRAGVNTPGVHRRIARWLMARHAGRDRRLLLMAFRGCGKSTLVGLWCAWRLSVQPELRILVLAADHSLAARMVATVRRIVERHPLCRHLLGGDESWASDRFTVRRAGAIREPSMLAQGITGNVTGARAELIICDDVEVAGNCDTPGKREELRERLGECEFILTPGGTILYVGTPHCAESLYAPAEAEGAFLAGYRRLRIPLLNPVGRSAWPERFPREAIQTLRDRVGPLPFRRQMMLECASSGTARLDPALIVRYGEEPDYREANGRPILSLLGRRLVSGGGFWDPAYGRPGQGDSSVLAATFADGEGNHYLHRLAYITQDPDGEPDPATQQCRRVAAIAKDLLLPVVRVETNGIGKFLPPLLRREMARAGAACTVVEHASHRAKQERILGALDPVMAARRLHAHEAVFRTAFPREMAEWKPGSDGVRDDALDAVAGCLLAEPVRLPALPPAPRGMSWRG